MHVQVTWVDGVGGIETASLLPVNPSGKVSLPLLQTQPEPWGFWRSTALNWSSLRSNSSKLPFKEWWGFSTATFLELFLVSRAQVLTFLFLDWGSFKKKRGFQNHIWYFQCLAKAAAWRCLLYLRKKMAFVYLDVGLLRLDVGQVSSGSVNVNWRCVFWCQECKYNNADQWNWEK